MGSEQADRHFEEQADEDYDEQVDEQVDEDFDEQADEYDEEADKKFAMFLDGILASADAASKHNRPKPFTLLAGIEIEVVVRPKPGITVESWEDAAQLYSEALTRNDVPNEIVTDSKATDYSKCLITQDRSITRDETRPNAWGFEFVSAISLIEPWLPFSLRKPWQPILENFEVLQSGKCGTHVHVSIFRPKGVAGGWDDLFGRLKRFATNALYFERCIDVLMPEERLNNRYCRSNRYNVKLRDLSDEQMMTMIEDIQLQPEVPGGSDGYEKLVDLVCPVEGDIRRRYYRWNFTRLLQPDKKGHTVEFRQPPGCQTDDDAHLWMTFTLAFVYGACNFDFDMSKPATMTQLIYLIRSGRQLVSPKIDPWHVCRIFDGKVIDLKEWPNEELEVVFEPQELADLQAEEWKEEVKVARMEACASDQTSGQLDSGGSSA